MNTYVEQIINNKTWILSSNTNKLIQNIKTPQKGILRYTEIIPEIDEFKGLLELIDEDIALLPPSRLRKLYDLLIPIFTRINSIQTTDKDKDKTDDQQKRNTIRFFEEATHEDAFFYRHKFEIWSIILESITLKNRRLLNENKIDNLIKDLEKTKSNAEEVYFKIEAVLKTSQEELAKGGVGKHAKLFQEQANEHTKSAKTWRWSAIGILVANIVFIVILYWFIISGIEESNKKIEIGIMSALIVSILSYSIVLCVRSYFAEKHNELINKHKANCLETYNTFIDSAPEDVKSSILLHATQTIFSHQSPGFLSKEALNQSPNPIMEIIRNVTNPPK